MARGFLSGLIWGGVVAVGAAAGVSLLVPMGPPPDAVQAVSGTATPVDVAQPGTPTTPIEEETAPQRTTAVREPAQPAPAPGGGGLADTTPAARPEVGEAVAPMAPPKVVTEAEAPAGRVVGGAPMQADATTPEPVAEPEAAITEETSISVEPTQPRVPALQEPAPPVAAISSRASMENAEDPADSEETAQRDAPQATTDDDTETDQETARIAVLPQAGIDASDSASDRPGTPVVPLTDRTENATAAPDASLPPVQAWAQPFENPDDKPLMAIVLIDDAQSVGAEALAAFPSPVTIAVDPMVPDAAERIARHRAAGFEIMALADLPPEAAPQDAEMLLGAILARVPEAVGVLEGPNTGIQGNRALADQVVAIVRDRGYGLVTQDNGLNTIPKLAARDGVPSSVVFRDFDGAGQSPTVMRRFLDQAAFRSGQVGGVVMLGRVRPDTISALLLWGLQDRASRVALAPVSAVLSSGQAPE